MTTDDITAFVGPYRWLSNFWPCQINFMGLTFPSVENAYQAAKCKDPIRRKLFLSCSAATAKSLGRQIEIHPDWDNIKLGVMFRLIEKKFQDPILRKILLDTGDHQLIEGNNWGDTFWGVCNGEGQNRLGKILMAERSLIRALAT